MRSTFTYTLLCYIFVGGMISKEGDKKEAVVTASAAVRKRKTKKNIKGKGWKKKIRTGRNLCL